MKKFILMFILIAVIGLLFGCGGSDYTTETFEQALLNGESVEGKTVSVEVKALEPDSAFGYNIQAGDSLNFVSAENPNVEPGDTIEITVDRYASMFGSFLITYKK